MRAAHWRSRRARVVAVAPAYAAALLVANLWLAQQSPARRSGALGRSSTDVANLERVPWRVIPASALWATHFLAYWLIAVVVCVGALERLRGPAVAALVAVVAHVLGTVVSEGAVAVQVATGSLPGSARHLLDVGPSYVVLGCGVAVAVSRGAPRVARLLCVAALLPLAVAGLGGSGVDEQVETVGHLTAAVVGAAAAFVLDRRKSRQTSVERAT